MGVDTDTHTQSTYQGIQAVLPEIRIVLQFREGRDEAFQLKEGEKEVEKWKIHSYTDLL